MLNALGALLWAAILASCGYLRGNLLELVLGDLSAQEKPLLNSLVVLTSSGWSIGRVRITSRPCRGAEPARRG